MRALTVAAMTAWSLAAVAMPPGQCAMDLTWAEADGKLRVNGSCGRAVDVERL